MEIINKIYQSADMHARYTIAEGVQWDGRSCAELYEPKI